MSSGERAMQNMFSWITLMPMLDKLSGRTSQALVTKNILLLIDEIDLYSHPEWQRKMIKQLIDTINLIQKGKKVQIIVTSHSPFILSDFSQQNIIYMRKDKQSGKTIVDNRMNHKQSFGSNIYTLLNDAFFLENGAIGEFAKNKIWYVYKELVQDKDFDDFKELISDKSLEEKKKYYHKLIDMLGDGLVKKEMHRLFNQKFGFAYTSTLIEEPKNVEELKKLKNQLESSLKTVNQMLGEE